MPRPDRLPAGPLRDLIGALHDLYAAAGRPGARQLSAAIRDRDDLRDTVSHETISAMLRGDALPRWVKVECLVRQLAVWAVTHPDPDEEVRRFHHLWLLASDTPAEARPTPPRQLRRDFVPPDAARPDHGQQAPAHPVAPPARVSLPARNPHFVGRQPLLDAVRAALTKRPGVTLCVHGLGGVGKSQLVTEYAYRWATQYDLMWWIPAEHPRLIRSALAALGERLELPASRDIRQTVGTVLDALETTALRWLLVYDNADRTDDVLPLIPATGGHTIVTSRNPEWADAGSAIEMDVFPRAESIDLLCRRGSDIPPEEADHLAERLGDLPLALAQVAAMQAATGMPVPEYLRLFAEHLDELLSSVPPAGYPYTVATFVTLALERLRGQAPAAAQLLELLALLSPEPVSVAFLRNGADDAIPPPLGRALRQLDSMDRIVGQLRRYGLARVDQHGQQIQVHRLVQLVLRETLTPEAADAARRSVRRLLAAANPGDPDDPRTWALHAEIGPHLLAADLLNSAAESERRTVLDQIRYLYQIGDFETSRRLGTAAVTAWRAPREEGGLGAEHELTFLAIRHLANALRALGDYEESRRITEEALDRLRGSAHYGADHPRTLDMAGVVGTYQRITGSYREALALDKEVVKRATRRYGPDHPATLRALSNLAVNLRLTGDFAAAHGIDAELVETRRAGLGDDDPRTLLSISNLARDLYGLGRYAEAYRVQAGALPAYRDRLGHQHIEVLLALRTIAIAVRKSGRFADAVALARENYHDHDTILGPDHEHTLAAGMSYANALHADGDAVGARSLATEALARYRRRFGERNPLALAAATNLAIILRSLGERREAYRVDQRTLDELRHVLGAEHPHTLAAAIGFATDLAQNHEFEAARSHGERTFGLSRRGRGDGHPDTLMCAVNLSLDVTATGDAERGREIATHALRRLSATLGAEHPVVMAAGTGERLECDIEPPPT